MFSKARTLSVVLGAVLILSGCGEPIKGTVTAKDYDKAESKRVTKCTSKKVNGKTKQTCKRVTKREAADWDITVRDSKGKEHEIEVSKAQYNRINVGDRYDASK